MPIHQKTPYRIKLRNRRVAVFRLTKALNAALSNANTPQQRLKTSLKLSPCHHLSGIFLSKRIREKNTHPVVVVVVREKNIIKSVVRVVGKMVPNGDMVTLQSLL